MSARGLTGAEVAERVAEGQINVSTTRTSRSVGSILRENVLTFFNGILTVCFLAVLLLGDLADGLFYGIVVVNAAIGIIQELRAKRSLDRLALLAEADVLVRRDGAELSIPPTQIVLGETVLLRPGDQVQADATVTASSDLLLDESMLTGESEPVAKTTGDALLSGSYVVSGTSEAEVVAVGSDAYANRLTERIRRRTLVYSELRAATNRILVYLTWILVPVIVIVLGGRLLTYGGGLDNLGAVEPTAWRQAALDAVASVVGMIPEGLVLLTSLAFGVAVIQLARQRVLVQELAAVEVLARVDVLCLDKTGTLTTGEIGFERLITLDEEVGEARIDAVLGSIAHDVAANQTALALRPHYAAPADVVSDRLPFSSRRGYSALTFGEGAAAETWLLGAPERLLPAGSDGLARAMEIASTGRRTLALALGDGRAADHADAIVGARPVAIAVFRESVRPDAAATLGYFAEQDVRTIVISGDNPVTVGSISGELGIRGDAVDASTLADDEVETALARTDVFGRVGPERKRDIVHALQADGRTVAMTGDGVNDAMAVKESDLGIAMGNATPATRAVSRIVLLDSRFERLPTVLSYARRVTANVERVSNLFITKTVYGIVLALVSAFLLWRFPFLPRQMTLVSTLAIGIPSFFLALAPNRRRYVPGVLRRILGFSVPAGLLAAATCVSVFALLSPVLPLDEARTATTISLFLPSLWVLCVLARPLTRWRLGLVVGVAVVFALAFLLPLGRDFFVLAVPQPIHVLIAVAIGCAGAGAIEAWYRLARRRGLVFDRE
ncbi:HAD-IC family P-type ATPase [Cnuibacter sp. UC19_7]|uniref:HAD-IC family P-type ATPase n=1 Tax=Cnuibacter sp. UC19_7 TaxID=3350166 RepID=UPI00366E7A60